ncbi:MAG: hypothetical protein JXL80_00270 [Planctomycetes bacterium]|nr:hypothetical protein [Planctomycetota bacterium]
MTEPVAGDDRERPSMSPEAARYAAVLRIGVRVALVLLVAVFCLYGFEIVQPHVPLKELPRYWSLSSAEYIEQTGMPTRWQWLDRLGEGDVLTILPAVFLASLTAVCLLAVQPLFARRGEHIHVIIILLHLFLIVLATIPGPGKH